MKLAPMTPEETESVEMLRTSLAALPPGFRVDREEGWTEEGCTVRFRISKPAGPLHWKLVAIVGGESLR